MGKKIRDLTVDAPVEIMAQRPEHCTLENAHPLTSHWIVVKGWLVPCRITLPEAAQ